MKTDSAILVTLFALLASRLGAQEVFTAKPAAEASTIGIGHKHTIASHVLGENVDLVVHLPADYAAGEQRYPILFFLGSEYRARFALAAATMDCMAAAAQLPPIILVGVDLPHGNFVQIPQENAAGTASADRQLAALADEIIPFVDRTFCTNGYRILYGGSNSGVFAVYGLLSGKLPCQAFIASSPMLGWCPNLIAEKATAAFSGLTRSNQFLFLVWSDDDLGRVMGEAPKFAELLRENAPGWLQWKTSIRHHEGHVPEMDLPLGLRALFPDYHPGTGLMTLQALQTHYATLSDRYGFALEAPDALIFDSGMTLATSGQLDEAQRIFEFAVEHHPRKARMHAGLGFVFRQRGDHKLAVGRLKKALELDPDDGWAKQQLAELDPPKGSARLIP